ncbi:MAG: hypothetical protein INF91_05425 [Alphaproteobacteria bacterium]|nr:hypothetical protein [Alphaproteobacteria bacterium]
MSRLSLFPALLMLAVAFLSAPNPAGARDSMVLLPTGPVVMNGVAPAQGLTPCADCLTA